MVIQISLLVSAFGYRNRADSDHRFSPYAESDPRSWLLVTVNDPVVRQFWALHLWLSLEWMTKFDHLVTLY